MTTLTVFEGLDFIMAQQEKVALVGKNGAGKTTLTRMLLKQESCTAGELNVGHNVDIGYYAQNQTDELDGNLTVMETLEEVAVGDIRKQLRGLLGSFLFSGEDVDKKVRCCQEVKRPVWPCASCFFTLTTCSFWTSPPTTWT